MLSDVIQTISDRPDLQSADVFRPRSDVCDLPVYLLRSPFLRIANTSRPPEDVLAARHSNHPPINWGTLARLGLGDVMGMDAGILRSRIRSAVGKSFGTAYIVSEKRCMAIWRIQK